MITETEKALSYYKAVALSLARGGYVGSIHAQIPKFVPKKIKRLSATATPGILTVQCNRSGAVSIARPYGFLGLDINEFEVIEWRENL